MGAELTLDDHDQLTPAASDNDAGVHTTPQTAQLPRALGDREVDGVYARLPVFPDCGFGDAVSAGVDDDAVGVIADRRVGHAPRASEAEVGLELNENEIIKGVRIDVLDVNQLRCREACERALTWMRP